MNCKQRKLFSNFTFENWRNLIIAAITVFQVIYTIAGFRQGAIGYDYIAYWSVGKIADEKGFSQIYEIDSLRVFYSNEIKEQGYFIDLDNITYSVPYLPVFILPFQLLSRLDLFSSFWMWNFFNIIILIGYLIFFLNRIDSQCEISTNKVYLLILVLISFPVIFNLNSGNVNVFLLICAGEFLRNAVNNKPLLSGLWLGGLLLKPPLLILIIPIFLIMRHWKVLKGFFVSSGIILFASLALAGFTGMKSLMDLWVKYPGDAYSNTAPEIMINWRMVGFTLDNQFNVSTGWVLTVLGIMLTVLAVYFLTKHIPHVGSPSWVATMLGVFSATLAITWHSHSYMAMVLIPFLIYVTVHKLLPEKIVFLWAIVTPVAMFGMDIIGLFDHLLLKIGVIEYKLTVIAFSGFIMNLVVLFSILKSTKINSKNDSLTQFTSATKVE